MFKLLLCISLFVCSAVASKREIKTPAYDSDPYDHGFLSFGDAFPPLKGHFFLNGWDHFPPFDFATGFKHGSLSKRFSPVHKNSFRRFRYDRIDPQYGSVDHAKGKFSSVYGYRRLSGEDAEAKEETYIGFHSDH